ncbi:ADP-ribosylation/Crystallin J1 [Phialemonium atrogriseum]|uniref:ADP-ribosylhydrolase ARH3 n=1 Tax=Phialemonium atrogriseum TaxID=1093897 RepID=A0AAJ0C2U3_9PEZI|nr:ADP-ribosylation/Crystallin J1 [Phialemonium atrogriseum]KAK1768078.1 ADP-ribosylation/Crystallin J1 [Phialemonium atrogriseum]
MDPSPPSPSSPPRSPRLARTIGALLGVHAGDALGATLEFRSWASIRRDYPQGLRNIVGGGPFHWAPGHATDDTDLTRAVLLAYRDAHSHARSDQADDDDDNFDVSRAAGAHMLAWLDGFWPNRRPGSRPPDVGGATATGLAAFRQTGDPGRAGAGPGQAGNGSLMRCVATGLFARDWDALVAESMRVSAVTHDDLRCTVACAAYNAVVRELVEGKEPAAAVETGLGVAGALEEGAGTGGSPVRDAIELGRRLGVAVMAENGPAALPGKGAGYVLESLTIAVAAVLDPRPLVDVLVDVVRIGSDTDTNGAIAGGLLGARDGVDALPEEWVEVLQFADEFVEIATELTAGGD